MEKETISLIISFFALLIAILSFYFQHRNVKKLYLIFSNSHFDRNCKFTLLNAANKDILIMGIKLCYKTNDGYCFPNQRNIPKEVDSLNLEKGKSSIFIPKFEFGLNAIDLKVVDKELSVDMLIHIVWIDYRGVQYENYCNVFKYNFDSNGEYKSIFRPIKSSYNLYKDSKIIS